MRQNELMKILTSMDGPKAVSVADYNKDMAIRLQDKGLVNVEIIPEISEHVMKDGRKRYFKRNVAVVKLVESKPN